MTEKMRYVPLPGSDGPTRYEYGPQSSQRPEVTAGRMVRFHMATSRSFPGASRDVRVHITAAAERFERSAVTVFQDGGLYYDPAGEVRAGVVLDNLVHDGQMPPSVGVFIDPGEPGNRNAEYDAFDARYADLVIDEILPRVADIVSIEDDAARRAIVGGSSGGNCALTAAWCRPEAFERVAMFLSSFAQIPGGNPYPDAIRAGAPRPLRVFQQAGTNDLNARSTHMNWLSENLQVAAAFAEAGYAHRFVLGDGGHDLNHTGVLLPDALGWLWE
ncbi:esterase family protein [Microbacterium sp. KRD172]|uniref:alpha/beta hydrolase n=1 Tax=Microbacterium sp. KRD172 TaxID=2729727 RepID=UPI001F49B823|nr:alpha/beta hydrolase-fold protein [Microbacterium sp. KRD172]